MFSFLGTERKQISQPASDVKPVVLVVIIPNKDDNYTDLFAGETLQDGRRIDVVEVTWGQFAVASYVGDRSINCYLHLTNGKTVKPDFLLIRSEVRGAVVEQDFRNSLFGLIYSNLPSVNSLHSVYCFLERPIVQAELNRLQLSLGRDVFPVVEQSFFSSHRGLMYGSSFPAVAKVGHAHAGYGKMKISDHHSMEDFRSVLAITPHYVTAEPFINGDYDLRIQKIGPHLRAFRRTTLSGTWKTNTGSSHLEEVEVTAQYRLWAEEASKLFGGLDICTVDAIHDSKTGQDVIMEINGTASGFSPETVTVDNQHVKEIVLEKMNATLIRR